MLLSGGTLSHRCQQQLFLRLLTLLSTSNTNCNSDLRGLGDRTAETFQLQELSFECAAFFILCGFSSDKSRRRERSQDNRMRKHIPKRTSRNSLLFISGLGYWDYLHMSFLECNIFWQKQPLQRRGSRSATHGSVRRPQNIAVCSTVELLNVAVSDRHRPITTKGPVSTMLEPSFTSRCSRK